MSVSSPPPMYIQASCFLMTLVQRASAESGYGSLGTMGRPVAPWPSG